MVHHKPCKQKVKVFQDNLDNQPRYSLNQAVFARNFGKGGRWVPGNIVRIISPGNFNVQVGDVVWKRHKEQLRPRFIPSTRYTESIQDPTLDSFTSSTWPNESPHSSWEPDVPISTGSSLEVDENGTSLDSDNPATEVGPPVSNYANDSDDVQASTPSVGDTPVRRYQVRDRKPPERIY